MENTFPFAILIQDRSPAIQMFEGKDALKFHVAARRADTRNEFLAFLRFGDVSVFAGRALVAFKGASPEEHCLRLNSSHDEIIRICAERLYHEIWKGNRFIKYALMHALQDVRQLADTVVQDIEETLT